MRTTLLGLLALALNFSFSAWANGPEVDIENAFRERCRAQADRLQMARGEKEEFLLQCLLDLKEAKRIKESGPDELDEMEARDEKKPRFYVP